MLATLADRAMGLASRLSNDGLPQTTIELELHYLDAGQLGEFVEVLARRHLHASGCVRRSQSRGNRAHLESHGNRPRTRAGEVVRRLA
jgi:acyl-coenzyme A thioesterase PaaI-like protein